MKASFVFLLTQGGGHDFRRVNPPRSTNIMQPLDISGGFFFSKYHRGHSRRVAKKRRPRVVFAAARN
jgi:hypothetical protein